MLRYIALVGLVLSSVPGELRAIKPPATYHREVVTELAEITNGGRNRKGMRNDERLGGEIGRQAKGDQRRITKERAKAKARRNEG